MNKNLIYTALLFMGIMGILAIGVVKADTIVTEPYGNINYTLNGNENFNAQVITITNGTDTITILDRNLGATAAGTGCEDPSWGTACAGGDDTYGYHFQWGNNYGFDPMDNDIATNSVSVTTNGVERSGNYSNSGYYGDTFIKSTRNPYGYDYWTDSVNNGPNHYDLWGGSLTESTDGVDADVFDDSYINGDDWKVNLETVTNRRGPCPENFHVPSAGELAKLVKMFGLDSGWNNYEDVSRAMHSQLKIPFAGLRDAYDASVYNFGDTAYLWSSSPYSASYPYSRRLTLDVDGDLDQYNDGRATGLSVRCFYDFYQPFTQSFTLSFMGSEGGSISTGSIEAEEGSSISRDDEAGSVSISGTVVATGIADEGYVFSGWLTDCVSGAITTGCSFTGEFIPITYEITYLGTGEDYVPSATGYTIKSDDVTLTNPSREGYTFTGRRGTALDELTMEVTIQKGSTGDRVYEANWEVNEYAITFVDGSGTEISVVYSGDYNSTVSTDYPNWTKDGYMIHWDKSIPATMPLNGVTITATWTQNPSPSSNGGGYSGRGGRNSSTQNSEQASEQAPQNDNSKTQDSSGNASEGQEILSPSDSSFTKEQKEAYEFAKEKGITTMQTINDANMNGKLTRIAMAKMLSYYAINVLGQKPDETRNNKFNDITEKLDAQYDNGVTLAYQLGIMGINMPDNKFRPNDEVTRAEFATALSRMLYSTLDGKPYYSTHLSKLKSEGILKNDDYKIKELRGYVMIMLMRSVK